LENLGGPEGAVGETAEKVSKKGGTGEPFTPLTIGAGEQNTTAETSGEGFQGSGSECLTLISPIMKIEEGGPKWVSGSGRR